MFYVTSPISINLKIHNFFKEKKIDDEPPQVFFQEIVKGYWRLPDGDFIWNFEG